MPALRILSYEEESCSFHSGEIGENFRGLGGFEVIAAAEVCAPLPRKHVLNTWKFTLHFPDLTECEFLVM